MQFIITSTGDEGEPWVGRMFAMYNGQPSRVLFTVHGMTHKEVQAAAREEINKRVKEMESFHNQMYTALNKNCGYEG